MQTPYHVLFVNDSASDSEKVGIALGSCSEEFELVEAKTLGDFETYLLQPDYAAVLVNLPVFDFQGTQAVARIQSALPGTPILLLTGPDTEWVALEAMRIGASGYLPKQPGYLERLPRCLQVAIDRGSLFEMKAQAERELIRSQTFNRAILDALTEHIAVLDQNGVILTVNDAWVRFAEKNGPIDTADVGPGTNYLDVCAKAADCGDRQARMALEGIQGILDGAIDSFSMEYPCHSPEEQRWFIISVTPIGEGFSGAVVVHTDITDRRIAEESLHQTRVQLDFTLRALSIGYWEWDLQTGEAYYSAEWKLQLGYDETEVTNHRESWKALLHPEDRESVVATMQEWSRSSLRTPLSALYRMLHKDGSYRKILCKASIQRDSTGKPLRMIGVHVDVTPGAHESED
ncbi:MAG: PAS domain-containing protein [Candidatus Hydrogenedentes bacterium]|nr:PAS domain-containing protein [Candidatus Hydrogenedentota bacterium]